MTVHVKQPNRKTASPKELEDNMTAQDNEENSKWSDLRPVSVTGSSTCNRLPHKFFYDMTPN